MIDGFVKMNDEDTRNKIKPNILDINCIDNKYDYTMCIAVIHHLSDEDENKTTNKRIPIPHKKVVKI